MNQTFTPLAVTVIFTLGLSILVLFALPGKQQITWIDVVASDGIVDRLKKALYAAGIFDRAPSLLLMALVVIAIILGLFLSVLLASIFAFILGPIAVWAGTYYYLSRRQRSFQKRAAEELVPFLNRIATGVVAGKPAQQAYLDAVEGSRVLREILEDSAAKIAAGERFSYALLETLPLLPLRMWAVFVRQLELYEEVGGDVSKAIERSVSQVNTMLQLQAEARADYAIQSFQQKIIILIIAGATFLMVVSDPGRFFSIFQSFAGIVGFILGISLMAFGVWFLNKQLLDVERKLSF